jgi:peptidyl-prolyl cis-trans isomerase SurA
VFLFIVYAQNKSEILFTVGDDSITLTEFINTYCKNNSLEKTSPSELRDYMDLFISFKLKVRDGIDTQIDTIPTFLKELESYRLQSAQQYLIDKEVTEQLVKEAIDRSKLMVRSSHILIMCAYDASPKDSMIAYQKIMDIRKKILAGTLTFPQAAVEFSEDPSARDEVGSNGKIQFGNKGDLGYFTVFDLIYPFESAAYQTPVGNISMPIRSQFGYHIVWVQDKQPLVSKISISQILLLDTAARFGRVSPSVQEKLVQIAEKLNNGEDFATIAEAYTDDPASKVTGGKIDAFPPKLRPGDFVKQCLLLDKGEISKPFSSVVGWHIIKLNELTMSEINDEEQKYSIISKVQRDARSSKSVESLIEKLKKEYNYSEKGKKEAINFLLKKLKSQDKLPPSTDLLLISGIDNLKPVAIYAGQTLTIKDFIAFLDRFQDIELSQQVTSFLTKQFESFINDNILKYEFFNLENKYPEYKELIKEYHQGMILFEMNNEKVWSESLKDSLKIEEFYEKVKFNYLDNEGNPKSLHDIRSAVITEYQNELENEWLTRLKEKYPVWINEELFESILKKK